MDCYKKFAHIYDELINEDINYAQWAKEIMLICNKYHVNFEDYLDLACGTGNITVEIAKHFKRVWAVDLSTDMLMEAEEKMRLEGKKANFVCQDLSDLNLNRKFDLITCCLDSTNYLLNDSDIENYFKGVYNLLKDDGIFIFDINSHYKLTEVLGNNVFTYDSEDVFYVWENVLEEDIVDMYLTFFIKDGQVYERFDENHKERAYEQEKIEGFLQHASLCVLDKLDSYVSKEINKNTERIVYVISKKKMEGGIITQ